LSVSDLRGFLHCRDLNGNWLQESVLPWRTMVHEPENAVKTQIWIAVSVYVLVAILRKRISLDLSLYQILQILSLTLFEKMPILQALQASDSDNILVDDGNHLILFDF
jgi:hypothetical protein